MQIHFIWGHVLWKSCKMASDILSPVLMWSSTISHTTLLTGTLLDIQKSYDLINLGSIQGVLWQSHTTQSYFRNVIWNHNPLEERIIWRNVIISNETNTNVELRSISYSTPGITALLTDGDCRTSMMAVIIIIINTYRSQIILFSFLPPITGTIRGRQRLYRFLHKYRLQFRLQGDVINIELTLNFPILFHVNLVLRWYFHIHKPACICTARSSNRLF
jgi:hypothetical protein